MQSDLAGSDSAGSPTGADKAVRQRGQSRRAVIDPSLEGQPLSKSQRKLAAKRARAEAQSLRRQAYLARVAQQKATEERERTAVSAKAERHLLRLREGAKEAAPWDEQFIFDLQDLMNRGRRDRALAVAMAVASELIPSQLPEATLRRRLQSAPGLMARQARASRNFMAFVDGELVPAHYEWVRRERRRAASPSLWQDSVVHEPERQVEIERERATILRRSISQRY